MSLWSTSVFQAAVPCGVVRRSAASAHRADTVRTTSTISQYHPIFYLDCFVRHLKQIFDHKCQYWGVSPSVPGSPANFSHCASVFAFHCLVVANSVFPWLQSPTLSLSIFTPLTTRSLPSFRTSLRLLHVLVLFDLLTCPFF